MMPFSTNLKDHGCRVDQAVTGWFILIRKNVMYIRLEGDQLILARSGSDEKGNPSEIVLANLGSDAELNLFLCAEQGRRERPDLWEGVTDFHLLQALENHKRRMGNMKPALVTVQGGTPPARADKGTESKE
jgi:hypothetical protein